MAEKMDKPPFETQSPKPEIQKIVIETNKSETPTSAEETPKHIKGTVSPDLKR